MGANFLVSGYSDTQGGVAFDSSLPLSNPDLETNSAVLGYARSLDLWVRSWKIDAGVPYTWLYGSADYLGETTQRTVDGFGDPVVRLSVNLYGAPTRMNLDTGKRSCVWTDEGRADLLAPDRNV